MAQYTSGFAMKSSRLEAFSDGVFAIIVTIMVLNFQVPATDSLAALRAMLPSFLAYLLSFVVVMIYWVNHHHLIHLVDRVNSRILWFNAMLLFWLSLMPFVTAYLSTHHASRTAVVMYGVIQSLSAWSYYFLYGSIARQRKADPHFALLNQHMTRKNRIALCISMAVIPMAFVNRWVAIALIVLPASMYFIPEKKVEQCELE